MFYYQTPYSVRMYISGAKLFIIFCLKLITFPTYAKAWLGMIWAEYISREYSKYDFSYVNNTNQICRIAYYDS